MLPEQAQQLPQAQDSNQGQSSEQVGGETGQLANCGFLLIDLAHQYCFANAKAVRQLKLNETPGSDCSLAELLSGFAPPARHLLYQAMWRCLASGQWQQLTLPYQRQTDLKRLRFLLLCVTESGQQRLCAFVRTLPGSTGVRAGQLVSIGFE